ncbi:hypothetical protein [uncultured Litoreibacter sp.]|uniref:hypothetical protein n=1 Tax=uncultured Litoreibacter sp. TaxID=1392394 RepID=UPI00262587E9|nr:hypothetical protein [uncultured Litoreibacter sp.]
MNRFVLTLATAVMATPLAAQNLTGNDLTLSGEITQNGAGTNFFDANVNAIAGRACIGPVCTGTETIVQDPLRLKWSEPDILFEDSSTATGISSNDWRLLINDVTVSKFAVQDVDGNTIPFTIEATAPDNSLFVEDSGDIGIGTSIPTGRIHVEDDFRADIRLHRNTSGGRTRSDWEMVSDSNGYYVNDLVNAQVPFRIENNAPVNALRIGAGTGNVGLGIASADAPLHVARNDGTARLIVENGGVSPSAVREMFKMSNNGGSFFTLENSQANTEWFFVHENASPNRFIITDGVADGPEMTLTADGNLTIEGQLFTAGSCTAGCDRVFDTDYPLPTIAEQAAMMRKLKHLPNVGPTPESGPFNITAMTGGMLNELEKAHLYIAQLEERLAAVEVQLKN